MNNLKWYIIKSERQIKIFESTYWENSCAICSPLRNILAMYNICITNQKKPFDHDLAM